MLKNTLILPESDARLAARTLLDAIDTLDVILMLVFGKGADVERVVGWADQLCEKTRLESGSTVRRVVWIRDTSSKTLQQVLEPILGDGATPLAAVLDFHDELRGTIAVGESVRPVLLERLFLHGGESR